MLGPRTHRAIDQTDDEPGLGVAKLPAWPDSPVGRVSRPTPEPSLATSPRQHFAISQQIVPAIINALINGGIAWGMHRGKDAVALWGEGGYWTDLVATGVLLPGLTWMILHPLTRWQHRQGKAPSTSGVPRPWLESWLPAGFWSGSALIGLLGGAVGLFATGMLHGLGAPSMSGGAYAVFKGLYGGMFPVLLQPAMVFAILRGTGRSGA
ncbi:MAG TPA: hypothetical protein PLF63_02545 [Rubrivivax sp.]|nr:hypothetical protein [Rubrivivax sp.]